MAEPVKPAVTLPPSRNPRGGDSRTGDRAVRRRSGFVPFLMAILVAAGLLIFIASQYSAWTGSKGLGQSADKNDLTTDKNEATAQKTPDTANPDDVKPSPLPPSAGDTAKPTEAETKPSPVEPAPKQDATVAPAKKTPPAPIPVAVAQAQPVQVISSPGGATAMLDGQRSTACSTPCSLTATPGRHTISVSMSGYQVEHREVEVGTGPVELPPMILRAPYGTLMLSSVPEGAVVTVNGKRIPQVTNTQLQLPAGTYKISVEKDGRQGTGTVDIHNDEIRTLRLILGN